MIVSRSTSSCPPVVNHQFYTNPATPQLYTLSLHDALPISQHDHVGLWQEVEQGRRLRARVQHQGSRFSNRDRKSTRLNSSHVAISYAVFCLKKKTNHTKRTGGIAVVEWAMLDHDRFEHSAQ